jgi:hypothetical protein
LRRNAASRFVTTSPSMRVLYVGMQRYWMAVAVSTLLVVILLAARLGWTLALTLAIGYFAPAVVLSTLPPIVVTCLVGDRGGWATRRQMVGGAIGASMAWVAALVVAGVSLRVFGQDVPTSDLGLAVVLYGAVVSAVTLATTRRYWSRVDGRDEP